MGVLEQFAILNPASLSMSIFSEVGPAWRRVCSRGKPVGRKQGRSDRSSILGRDWLEILSNGKELGLFWIAKGYCQNVQSCRHLVEKEVCFSNLQKGNFWANSSLA